MLVHEVLFRDARIIDGTGSASFRGDLLVTGQRIAAIHHQDQAPRTLSHAEQIDASGLVLCPGFIDIHSNSIQSLLEDGRSVSKISQGITTEIMGETWTPAPINHRVERLLGERWHWPGFGQWLDAMAQQGVSANVGSLLPGHNIRACVMGLRSDAPTGDELTAMKQLVAQAMDEGAFGVAYALIYPPDFYTQTQEIIEICRVAAQHGGIYCTHMRSEGDRLLEGIDEAIAIGRATGIPVEIYHLKSCGQRNWSKMPEALARINRARAQGIDIEANMYPYTASGTSLTTILPPWAAADGKLFHNLADTITRQRIREEVLHPDGSWEPQLSVTGAEHIMPLGLRSPECSRYAGWRLDRIADDLKLDVVDAVIELLRIEGQPIFAIFFKMSEENTELQLQQPWVKISTDAHAVDPLQPQGMVHPRCYGSMPRVLGHYVRTRRVLSLEDAIARMTGHVARRLNLSDRGTLSVGSMADLVLFDPQTITDCATFERPHQLSRGIHGVWVNGVRVWNAQGHTGAKPGHVLRRSGSRVRTSDLHENDSLTDRCTQVA